MTLIDDNKYVSVDYCCKFLAVTVYMFQGAVARGDSRINKNVKTKEAEWSIYKLSTGLQLVSRLVILLGSVLALVGGIQCCVLIITLPPPYL